MNVAAARMIIFSEWNNRMYRSIFLIAACLTMVTTGCSSGTEEAYVPVGLSEPLKLENETMTSDARDEPPVMPEM